MVLDITDENFASEVLESDTPYVILFTGSWCTWCEEMLQRLDEAIEDLDGAVRAGTVDIDEQRRLRISFAVGTLPYIVLIRDGMRIPLFDEIVTVDRLVERIRYILDGGKVPLETPVVLR